MKQETKEDIQKRYDLYQSHAPNHMAHWKLKRANALARCSRQLKTDRELERKEDAK